MARKSKQNRRKEQRAKKVAKKKAASSKSFDYDSVADRLADEIQEFFVDKEPHLFDAIRGKLVDEEEAIVESIDIAAARSNAPDKKKLQQMIAARMVEYFARKGYNVERQRDGYKDAIDVIGWIHNNPDAPEGVCRQKLEEGIALLPEKDRAKVLKEAEAMLSRRRDVFADEQRSRAVITKEPWLPVDATDEEITVETYMILMQLLYKGSKGMGSFRSLAGEERIRRVQEYRTGWAIGKTAKVYHVGRRTYSDIDTEIDRHVTEDVAGFRFGDFWDGELGATEEAKKHFMLTVSMQAGRQGFPEKMPFSRMFIGYGPGVWMSADNIRLRFAGQAGTLPPSLEGGAIVGHLVSDTGWVWEMVRLNTRDETGYPSESFIIEQVRNPDGGWVRSSTCYAPWMVPQIIEFLMEFRTFVEEHEVSGFGRRYRKDRKKMGLTGKEMTPPPFYRMVVKDTLIKKRTESMFPKQRRPKAYRSDVAAHERVLIKRGSLPIEPKLKEKLETPNSKGNKYKVFTLEPLDAATLQRLHRRGVDPKRKDEWIAVMVVQIDEHQSPKNPDLPYIPQLRVIPSRSAHA